MSSESIKRPSISKKHARTGGKSNPEGRLTLWQLSSMGYTYFAAMSLLSFVTGGMGNTMIMQVDQFNQIIKRLILSVKFRIQVITPPINNKTKICKWGKITSEAKESNYE